MDSDFFLNAGVQFKPSSQPPWKLMTLMPDMSLLPEHATNEWFSRPIWENSDKYPDSQFESAMSSMVSSPVSNSNVSNDIVAVRELAGKLAALTAPPPYGGTNTPLNSSPPSLNLPIMDHFAKENLPRIQNPMPLNPDLQLLAEDPGFAERAAKFSCFGSRSFNGRTNQLGLNSNKTETVFESDFSPATIAGKFPPVSSRPAVKSDRSPVGFEENKNSDEINMKSSRMLASAANSNQESSISEQIPCGEVGFKNPKDSTSRKRKAVSTRKEEEAIDDSKRPKKTRQENGDKKPPEPPKDYIHVRARRGQATDSHSLAERVRREKISQRMKLLQNLVPNCNKVTGKALMLDEIINYVQSLQRQVEFLSMKLATVYPNLDMPTTDIISKNINQSNGNLSQQASTSYQQNHQKLFKDSPSITQSIEDFTKPFSHFQGFDQADLQSIVQMGFGENLDLMSFFDTSMGQRSDMRTKF